jgi:hypothetical protein
MSILALSMLLDFGISNLLRVRAISQAESGELQLMETVGRQTLPQEAFPKGTGVLGYVALACGGNDEDD